MKHMVLALDLVDAPEAIAEYEHVHRPGGPPQAVTDSIRAAGIRTMNIFRVADRLVMIAEVEDDFAGFGAEPAGQPDPEVQAWDAAMAALQRPIPGSGATGWAEMRAVYRLDDQP